MSVLPMAKSGRGEISALQLRTIYIRIMKQRIKKHLKEWGGLYVLEGTILAFFVYCWVFNYLRVTYDLGWNFSVIKFFLDRIM